MQIPDLSDIPELRVVEPGSYNIRITKAKDITAENGRPGIMLVCDIVDVDDAETLFHNLWMVRDSDPEDKATTMFRMLKEFVVGVGLDPASAETPEFEGCEFEALLDTDEYQGRDKNIITRIVG